MIKDSTAKFFIPALIVLFLILGIILFPNDSLNAAKEGLNIWTTVLIPSLLPFIIGANLIVDLKIVDIIGFIINPITKFIFNVSGKGALVFVISTVSGYPVGSKLASELRINKEISKSEAQRLVSFCSTSGPLFIIGSVATGMFQNSSLGYLMILCHYLGSISVGLLFRNYGKEILSKSNTSIKSNIKSIITYKNSENKGFFVLFGDAVHNGVNTLLMVGGFVIVFSVIFKVLSLFNITYKNSENKGFFVLFGDAVHNGVNTLLMVGGFVIVFSVIFKVLSLFNIVTFISNLLYLPLSLLGVTKELCHAFISGLFEMTIGCNNIASVSNASEAIKVSLCSFLIGFSGLSILAQCCNFLAKTDINTNIYIFSKFLHGVIASIFTFFLYPIVESSSSISTFSNIYDNFYNNSVWNYYISNFKYIVPIFIIIYILTSLIILEKMSINKKKS